MKDLFVKLWCRGMCPNGRVAIFFIGYLLFLIVYYRFVRIWYFLICENESFKNAIFLFKIYISL
ncbi:hypothetical protein HMPREF9441_00232 [Paraprevotella clara YIT 11840]|uniref:Uncharacterized protein n=1 Tax=Paraprevotella clara YIT 11840 TaxID=762968 RepID=G5SLL3_9BACT|nr:hypothetical protein HMPREF9441_00232 [Paraprevotella clara YIT 11840]